MILLSIYGAFIGAERAKSLFNSTLMIVLWVSILLIFIIGSVVFSSLRKNVSLALIHIAPVLIIIGGMIGSEKGHQLQKKYLGIEKAYYGTMLIYEGSESDKIYLDGNSFVQLPFSLKLRDFKVLYYQKDTLYLDAGGGDIQSYDLGDDSSIVFEDGTRLEVVKRFDNLRVDLNGKDRQIIDKPGEGLNYAAQVRIIYPNGKTITRYAFKSGLVSGGAMSADHISYHRTIRDYISSIDVIEDGKTIKTAEIEVNKPLHYGGYHFYQSSYDSKRGQYTVFSVHSDSGSMISYIGFIMLAVGIFWRFWFGKIFVFRKGLNGD